MEMLKELKVINNSMEPMTFMEKYGDLKDFCYVLSMDLSGLKLTSLKGCPQYIRGDFSCSKNDLENLVGFPAGVSGVFDCSFNKRLHKTEVLSLCGALKPDKIKSDLFNSGEISGLYELSRKTEPSCLANLCVKLDYDYENIKKALELING